MMDFLNYVNTINPAHFSPIVVGWFVKIHYQTTKNMFKKLFRYEKLKVLFMEGKVDKEYKNSIYSNVLSNFYYYMYPDIMLPSHGWNMLNDQGDILDMIGRAYDELTIQIKQWQNDKPDKNTMSIALGSLSHLIGDSYTIGQISPSFWGKIDDRIDFWSEWCRAGFNSRHANDVMPILTKSELIDYIHKGIIETYALWNNRAADWRKCIYKRWCWLGPWKVRKYVHIQSAKATDAIAIAVFSSYRAAELSKRTTKEISNVSAKKKAK